MAVGRVISALLETGMMDETLVRRIFSSSCLLSFLYLKVILVGDHGGDFRSFGVALEKTIRVPVLIRGGTQYMLRDRYVLTKYA